MIEEWRAIPGHEHYEVSNAGRVRSIDRDAPHPRWSGHTRRLPGKELARIRRGDGHLVVSLGRERRAFVHTLVLEAFVGPRPEGQECRHLNDIPDDNRLENLCWGTTAENRTDRIRNGKDHQLRKTHCPRGHLLQAPNLNEWQLAHGRRACQACRAARRGRSGCVDSTVADREYARIMEGAE